ncbi:MAG: hypothetical protein NC236_00315 [Mycoplasma sp.]|nr:hypothetical protein [Mycoplasma sp.]
MLIFYIVFPIYLVFAIILLIYQMKSIGKRRHLALTIFHSLTLMIFSPIFIIINKKTRAKYRKNTPWMIEEIEKRKVKYHLVWGTLLFAYRNNNFGDDDIDLGMFREDFNDKNLKAFTEIGFKLSEEWSIGSKVYERTYLHKKRKLSLDIFVVDKGHEKGMSFDEKNNRYSRRPTNIDYDIERIKIADIKSNVPKDIEKYLEWAYGDWKKPDKKYHWFYGPSKYPATIINDANIKYKKY